MIPGDPTVVCFMLEVLGMYPKRKRELLKNGHGKPLVFETVKQAKHYIRNHRILGAEIVTRNK